MVPPSFPLRVLLAGSIVVAGSTVASGAAAQGEAPTPSETTNVEKPASYEGVELAGIAGYLSPPVRGGTTPFGLGFGARLGLAYEHLYLGVRGMGYLGGSDVDITDQSLMAGGEIGYGLHLASGSAGRLTLRPLVGAGGAVIFHTDPSLLKNASTTTSGGRSRSVDVVSSASGRGGGASDVTTVSSVYLRPALVLMYSTGSFFAGAETSAVLLPAIAYGGESATWLSYGLEGQIGCRF